MSMAVVGAGAQIGNGCVIGPSSVIDGNVVLGDECRLGPSVMLTGNTTIGKGNRFFHGASIGNDPQDLKFHGEKTYLKIGRGSGFTRSIRK